MLTLGTVLIGILVPLFTELVTLINKKISGTTLSGKGAWILAVCIAFIGGIIDYTIKGNGTFQSLGKDVMAIYAISEVFFNGIMTTFKMTVPNEG